MDINEIARLAGVSRATVSRYLNDGYVSKQKRELISRIIQETGYVPSRRAQQLRTGKSHLVGVIIPKIDSQSVARMVSGITTVLAENDYQVVLASTDNNERTEVDYLHLFAKHSQLDGIILIATVFTPEHGEALKAIRVPVVVLGQKAAENFCVYQNDYHAAHDITALALAKGHKPAYLGVLEEDVAMGRERHRGFLDACSEAGIQPPAEAQLVVEFDFDSGYFGAEKILGSMPDVDTIVCASDTIALGAMMCMVEYGRSVPDDVQVTGFGDSMLSRVIRPSLTTVHLPYKTSGAVAARTLLDQIHGNNPEVTQAEMSYSIYARMSTR